MSRIHLNWLLLPAFVLLLPVCSYAQYPQPTSLDASPSYLVRPGSYTLCAGNGANMTLDVYYTLSGGGGGPLYGWPSLNAYGCASIYADETTPVGSYQFTAAKNTLNADWVGVYTYVYIDAPPPPPQQPTSLSFNPTSGNAGNSCYTMTVGNGANMTVDFKYLRSGVLQDTFTAQMNSLGQWTYCPSHYDIVGLYRFTKIKNNVIPDTPENWVPLPAPGVDYNLGNPVPTSLSLSPSSVTEGGTYRMTVGNGANLALSYTDLTLPDGTTQRMFNWPSLAPVSPGSWNGQADLTSNTCMLPGMWHFTIGVYPSPQTATAPITFNAAGPPSITSVTPGGAGPGSSVIVTINGTNICGVTAAYLSTTWPGITFSDYSWAEGSEHVRFNISSTAPIGTATITLSAGGGSTTFPFTILLSKEYVYLGGQLVAIETAR